MDSKYTISFKAVIETEVSITKDNTELTYESLGDLLNCMTNNEEQSRTIKVDEVNEEHNEELHDLFLSFVPDELKKNCVSMVFTDITVTPNDTIS